MRSTDVIDWGKYSNFKEIEFRCKYTGFCYMNKDFMEALQEVRSQYGKPMIINSGYRAPSHPAEAKKPIPGEHTLGRAVDVAVRGADAVILMRIAIDHGLNRIGVNQASDNRFLHLGMCSPGFPGPMIWSY